MPACFLLALVFQYKGVMVMGIEQSGFLSGEV